MKLFRLIKVSKTKDGNETKSVVTEACDMKTLQVLINSCKGEDCTFEWEEVILKQAEAPKEEKEEKKPEEKKAKSKKKEEAEEDDEEDEEESGLMEKIKTGAKYALVGGIGVGAGWLAHSVFGKKNNNE